MKLCNSHRSEPSTDSAPYYIRDFFFQLASLVSYSFALGSFIDLCVPLLFRSLS